MELREDTKRTRTHTMGLVPTKIYFYVLFCRRKQRFSLGIHTHTHVSWHEMQLFCSCKTHTRWESTSACRTSAPHVEERGKRNWKFAFQWITSYLLHREMKEILVQNVPFRCGSQVYFPVATVRRAINSLLSANKVPGAHLFSLQNDSVCQIYKWQHLVAQSPVNSGCTWHEVTLISKVNGWQSDQRPMDPFKQNAPNPHIPQPHRSEQLEKHLNKQRCHANQTKYPQWMVAIVYPPPHGPVNLSNDPPAVLHDFAYENHVSVN